MSFNAKYLSKKITIEAAVDMIKSGDRVVLSPGANEPMAIIDHLPLIVDRVKNVTLFTMLSMKLYDIYKNKKYNGIFHTESGFFSKPLRIACQNGLASFVPMHLRNIGPIISKQHMNILFTLVSPMDRGGFFSTGTDGGVYQKDVLQNVDKVIAVVNPRCPRTFGDASIHIDNVDYICECDHLLGTLLPEETTKEDGMIADYIADLIEDGSTLQLGIGGIPNAVADKLKSKKNLGIHTEMMNDAIMGLVEAGAVDGTKKSIHPQKIIACFSLGGQKLYDFIDDNPSILHYRCSYTNNPMVIAQNKKMVSVNTTLQVDFCGQCASESVINQQISGTGGQIETAVGSQMTEGGKSIIAMHSTALVKDPSSDKTVRVSKIVPQFESGTFITLARAEVEYIVTEYGVVRLKGASVPQRAKLLIDIAHPDFRDQLKFNAKKMQLL